jgi:hypothetical protein
MRNNLIIIIISLILLNVLGCTKDQPYPEPIPGIPDFMQYYYFDTLPLSSATKQIPGVGSAPWICNAKTLTAPSNHKIFAIEFETCSALFIEKYNYVADREKLLISNFNLEVGDFSDKLGSSLFTGISTPKIEVDFFRMTAEGDVLTGVWKLWPSIWNSFVITKINHAKNTYSGTYNFYLYEDYGGISVAPYSKRINFLNGKFTLPIPK